jgi:hypothetical protein
MRVHHTADTYAAAPDADTEADSHSKPNRHS